MANQQERTTDVIVLGAGAVGENVADRAVKGGLEAIVIEERLVGGQCSYWACIPSKALLRPGAALAAARRVPGAREAVTGRLDVEAVLEHRTWFTDNWDDSGQVEWLDGAGIGLVRGRGRIVSDRRVEVTRADGTAETWQARQAVVIATGSKPAVPSIEGLDQVPFWGTNEASEASSVPERLAIIGGGVSSVEFAQAFARLGSRVTLTARSGLVGAFPDKAVDLLRHALEADGINLRLGTEPARVSHERGGEVQVTLKSGETITADQLLVSTGRKPAIDGIGLDRVGLTDGLNGIGPDGRVEGVEGGWLYVAGDAAGKVLLTHQGKYQARVTGDAIAARAKGDLGADVPPWSRYAATANDAAVPSVVFTDPELAMVGLSESMAAEKRMRVRTVDVAIDVSGAVLHADGYEGWAQLIIDEDRQVVVGATFAGQDVAEMLHAATIAIVGEVPISRLWHAVPAYPTMSEVWLRLMEAYGH